MKVVLVETALPSAKGSMRRYASLVEAAFEDDEEIQIERVCVARPVDRFPGKLRTLAHHFAAIRNGRRLTKDSSVDLFHVIDGSHGYLAKVLRNRPTLVTVHDVIPMLQCAGHFDAPVPGRISRRIIHSAVRGLDFANHLIFDSVSTQNDCEMVGVACRGGRSVVFPPLERQIQNADSTSGTALTDSPYIFHIGNNGFYKNREGVIRVFSEIAAEVPHRLVMAGAPPLDFHRQLAEENGIATRVDFVVDPSDDEVRSLYRNADALVFPSLYEGFGWPPIEAMALGCPVVCSSAGSLKEVVGDAASVSPPGDVETMARQLWEVLTNQAKSEQLIENGRRHAIQFGLEGFGQKLRAIYLDLVK